MSQSGRRGPAIMAASSQFCDLTDLANRGQWSLDSFATIMEYICATSISDQKVGRVLSGWENPQLQVHPPTLDAIVCSSIEREKIGDFVTNLFKLSMHKLVKRSFANALTAVVLMYFRDTLQACADHRLHNRMLEVAREIFPFDNLDEMKSKLLHWGNKIRTRFIMDNLTQFKSSVILSNLSEEDIAIKFVGANTFADVLAKLVGGYRGLSRETTELRSQVQDLMDSMNSLTAVIKDQSQALHDHLRVQSISANVCASEAIQNPEKAIRSMLKQVRRWPQTIQSLSGVRLSSLICQYVGERLDMIPLEPNNKAQNEVSRAINIASKFNSDITKLHSLYGGERPNVADMTMWRTASQIIESQVLECIETHKKSGTDTKRRKKHTGVVSSVVRTWHHLKLDATFNS